VVYFIVSLTLLINWKEYNDECENIVKEYISSIESVAFNQKYALKGWKNVQKKLKVYFRARKLSRKEILKIEADLNDFFGTSSIPKPYKYGTNEFYFYLYLHFGFKSDINAQFLQILSEIYFSHNRYRLKINRFDIIKKSKNTDYIFIELYEHSERHPPEKLLGRDKFFDSLKRINKQITQYDEHNIDSNLLEEKVEISSIYNKKQYVIGTTGEYSHIERERIIDYRNSKLLLKMKYASERKKIFEKACKELTNFNMNNKIVVMAHGDSMHVHD